MKKVKSSAVTQASLDKVLGAVDSLYNSTGKWPGVAALAKKVKMTWEVVDYRVDKLVKAKKVKRKNGKVVLV